MFEIFLLLIAFQFKHLVADYYLQIPFMYENKGNKDDWAVPLGIHAVVHGLFTFMIAFTYAYFTDWSIEITIGIAAMYVDAVTHFVIDRWKATRTSGIHTEQFWYNLGIDQMLHHLVGIGIIYLLVTS